MESQIESVKALDAYRLRQVKHIPELNSDGMILEHKKTGANIFLMSNEDNNKVFCIGFRTPPSDSRPMRCRALPHSRQLDMASKKAGFWKKAPVSMSRLMRGRSWNTTRPAPMLVWPTSLLPICPSGRPTSRPEARSVVWAYSRKNWSSRGVAAARMALPSVSCRRPKPSMMMRVVGVLFIEISSRSLSHKTALPELTPGWLR